MCVCVCVRVHVCVCAHHSWSITRQSYLIKFERENLTNFSALVPLSSIGKLPKLELIDIFQSYSRFTQRMYEQVLCLLVCLSLERKNCGWCVCRLYCIGYIKDLSHSSGCAGRYISKK